MREAHIVKTKRGYIVKTIDHVNRAEQIDVFTDLGAAQTEIAEFLGSNASPVRLAVPVAAPAQ